MEEDVIELTQEQMDTIDEAIESEKVSVVVEPLRNPCEFAFGGYVFKTSSHYDGAHQAVRSDGVECEVILLSGKLKKIIYK